MSDDQLSGKEGKCKLYKGIALYACLSVVRYEMETQACLSSLSKQPSIILPLLLPDLHTSMHAVACSRPYCSRLLPVVRFRLYCVPRTESSLNRH
jgi:hypothetical protein